MLDTWEKAEGTTDLPALPDPKGGTLPLLRKMGANWNHKDAFIEVGYMDTYGLAGNQPQARLIWLGNPGGALAPAEPPRSLEVGW